jgi:ATP-dependent DNA helicase RecG
VSERLAKLAEIPVGELRGVGSRRSVALAALGVSSVLDLLMHYPRRYDDRTAMSCIAGLVEGGDVSVRAVVRHCRSRQLRGRRSMVEAVLDDASGPQLTVTFFNQPWRARQLAEGVVVVVHGRIQTFRHGVQMTNPRLDVVAADQRDGAAELGPTAGAGTGAAASSGRNAGRQTGRIVPVYPQSEKAGIASYEIAELVEQALRLADELGALTDPLSDARREALDLVGRAEAFHEIHVPSSESARLRARRRLAFDELWRLQVALVMRKRAATAEARGIRHDSGARLVETFLDGLPFTLTSAQLHALEEIRSDLESPRPMHRLLQGDVGAGKTVVALATLLAAVGGGCQGAFMVPTEVLAEQHALAATRLLSGLTVADDSGRGRERPVSVALLTSRTAAAERARVTAGLHSGTVDVVVGTHALLTDDVRFSRLGVVVVDEQHRFGVDQRAALREKGAHGHDPDLLVMTATPIPRTAAMTVYGDLDSTVLEGLPPGRTPVETHWVVDLAGERAVWEHVCREVASGHQAYVVCPLVRSDDEPADVDVDPDADSDADADSDPGTDPDAGGAARQLHGAVEERERLACGELASCRIGLLHGQLRPSEKAEVMAAFRSGALDVLVATTVVEVGVDVANATVMVVEDADRFGIAQLHQLRGRVGRGSDASVCYLLAPEYGDTPAARRLRALEASTDGFELAEVDLQLRGEGTVLGARQQGRNDLRLASLATDGDLVEPAHRLAESVLDRDPGLVRHPLFAEELRLFVGDEEAAYLFRS